MSEFPRLSVPTLPPEQLLQAQSRIEELYGLVKSNWQGFMEREGQVTLIKMALETLLNARTANNAVMDGANLAILEAGTGTGKTIGYCLAAIVASEILGLKVVVSTATVALQEQLYLKDLPRLAAFIPSLSYEMMKGRSRYVCKSRLETAVHGDAQTDMVDSLSEEDDGAVDDSGSSHRAPVNERTLQWFASLESALEKGKWDGDIDSLGAMADEADWRAIQADANACHAQRCRWFKDCSFYSARRKAQGASIHVANHALVLAALSNESAMFDPANTLFVFDEAHHLPDIATEQFGHNVQLGQGRKALVALRKTLGQSLRVLPAAERPDLSDMATIVKASSEMLMRMQDFMFESQLVGPESKTFRFKHGQLATDLMAECTHLSTMLSSVVSTAQQVRDQLTLETEDLSPKEKDNRAKAASNIGPHLHRVHQLRELFAAWSTEAAIPLAKWVEWTEGRGGPDVHLCASPLTGSQGLTRGLWKNVSAAVCTSATLSACGSFDFFERLSGLNRYRGRRSAVMPSPFDYQRQGFLHLPPLKNSPKQDAFSSEFSGILPELLRAHGGGQLALFTSRRQMEATYQALPDDIRGMVLMQNTRSRQQILQTHRERVDAGDSSIIFGLQSMGEGLDLPGALCEHVLIDRLPFTPPTSPVEEALSEWLETQHRDAFNELSVPRTAMRLAQWVGRAVRTVHDRATITICDNRISKTAYGRRILQGLPNFSRVQT